MNAISMGYSIHILFYNKKGLRFLEHVKGVMLENDDVDELAELTEEDIPVLEEQLYATKGMLYLASTTILINSIGTIFAVLPSLQVTTGWTIIMWTMALSNSFVMLSLFSFSKVKAHINATCESYNLILQSYEHIKEYEENNNDSSNGL